MDTERADFKIIAGYESFGLVGEYFRRHIMSDLKKLACSEVKILLAGEPGTGKELMARAIHGMNADSRNIVVVNCSAIPENLLESELFGHTKGSFTGATEASVGKVKMAEGGTLFLDEIGDLPIFQQPKLLRMIEYGEIQPVGSKNIEKISTRIIAATNKNLEDLVRKKLFRQDLLDRLAGHTFEIAPLRERLYDLPVLTKHFLSTFCESYKKDLGDMAGIVTDLLAQELTHYSWPGNVRELRNFIQKCVILGRVAPIVPDGDDVVEDEGNFRPTSMDVYVETARLQRFLLQKALAKSQGNKTRAADMLGISVGTVHRWLK